MVRLLTAIGLAVALLSVGLATAAGAVPARAEHARQVASTPSSRHGAHPAPRSHGHRHRRPPPPTTTRPPVPNPVTTPVPTTTLPPQHTEAAGTTVHVSILDFLFNPATITVHAGDTVLWTNLGAAPHTVTADNGAFDSSPSCNTLTGTGCLQHGQTYAHVFTTPGTFTYHCKVHPFMHGTVVVEAAVTTTTQPPGTTHSHKHSTATPTASTSPAQGTGSAGSSGSSATSSAGAQPSSAGTLPFTGLSAVVVLMFVIGLLFIASGTGLLASVRRLDRQRGHHPPGGSA